MARSERLIDRTWLDFQNAVDAKLREVDRAVQQSLFSGQVEVQSR